MKLNNVLLILFGVLPIWPQMTGRSQGTLDSIKYYRHEIKADSLKAANDSLTAVRDSLTDKVQDYVASLEKSANRLPEKVEKLKSSVEKLKNKPPDTMAITRIKYVPTLGPVDKDSYYQEQKRITDSMAVARKDSIRQSWKDRSLFRKALGLKPKKQKR